MIECRAEYYGIHSYDFATKRQAVALRKGSFLTKIQMNMNFHRLAGTWRLTIVLPKP